MNVESRFDPMPAAMQYRFRTRPGRVYFATINDHPTKVTVFNLAGTNVRVHHSDFEDTIPRVGAGWTAAEAILGARRARRGPSSPFLPF